MSDIQEQNIDQLLEKKKKKKLEWEAFFEIKDNGCGISKDRLKNIFDGYCSSEAFIPDSTKNNAGIGLSVCATIIKAHDGEISVESSKNGTLFRFVLTMEESDNE